MTHSTILEDALAGRAVILPWTVDQYHAAIDAGFLVESPAHELLDGFIVRKDRAKAGEDLMTIGDRHAQVVQRLVRLASQFDRFGVHLRIQAPIALPPSNEPEPDAAVVRGSEDDYSDHRPEPADVLSVIEIADSSLSRDLGAKLLAYASAGIAQYIVVDLVNDRILVHTQPNGQTYAQTVTLHRGQTLHVSAGVSETVEVPADRLLP